MSHRADCVCVNWGVTTELSAGLVLSPWLSRKPVVLPGKAFLRFASFPSILSTAVASAFSPVSVFPAMSLTAVPFHFDGQIICATNKSLRCWIFWGFVLIAGYNWTIFFPPCVLVIFFNHLHNIATSRLLVCLTACLPACLPIFSLVHPSVCPVCLPVNLSVFTCPDIFLSVCLPACLYLSVFLSVSTCLSSVCLSVCVSTCLSLPVQPSVYLSVYLPVCLYLSVHLSILSVFLSVCLPVCLYQSSHLSILSFCLCTCLSLSVRPSVYISCLCVCWPVCLSVFTCPSICLSVFLSTCLPVFTCSSICRYPTDACLSSPVQIAVCSIHISSFCLSVNLSAYLCTCPSTCLSHLPFFSFFHLILSVFLFAFASVHVSTVSYRCHSVSVIIYRYINFFLIVIQTMVNFWNSDQSMQSMQCTCANRMSYLQNAAWKQIETLWHFLKKSF